MIIGLSGKMRSGKTTTANALISKLPNYERVAFGDVLKEEVAAVYEFPVEWCYSEEGKNKEIGHSIEPITVRRQLQFYGHSKRQENPDYWLEKMSERIAASSSQHHIIDDVRYPNEAEFVLSRGGLLIRLDPLGGWWEEDAEYGQHESETALDDYDGFHARFDVVRGGVEVSVSRVMWMLCNMIDKK